MAMIGDPITSYQKEVVPKFLLHLREVDPKMWKLLIKERPDLDTEPDHVGRKALLKTLNYPISWKTQGNKYPVEWNWDGEKLTTNSHHAVNNTWCQLTPKELSLTVWPKDNQDIVVQDNSWVNNNTVFTT